MNLTIKLATLSNGTVLIDTTFKGLNATKTHSCQKIESASDSTIELYYCIGVVIETFLSAFAEMQYSGLHLV